MTLDFIKFVLEVFGAASLTRVLVSRTDLRFFGWLDRKPFNCPLCMGFWFGIAFWWGFNPGCSWLEYAAHGFVGAGSTWILYRWVTGDY